MHPSIARARAVLAASEAREAGFSYRSPLVTRKAGDNLVRKTTQTAQTSGLDFILSDESVDRYGDVILSSGWKLDAFQKNPIALFNHNPNFVIGTWENLSVRDRALRGTLRLAPKDSSARIRELHALINAGILKAVSVGFAPLSYKPREDHDSGYVYEQSELVETSLVAIPANPNAVMEVKRLNISEETQELVFTNRTRRVKQPRAAEHPRPLPRPTLTPEQENDPWNKWLRSWIRYENQAVEDRIFRAVSEALAASRTELRHEYQSEVNAVVRLLCDEAKAKQILDALWAGYPERQRLAAAHADKFLRKITGKDE